jgi:hypothetical protein
VKKFVDWLESEAEDYGLLSPPLNPQFALGFLKDYLLGEDWYTVSPISTEQINTEIVFYILYKHSKKFRIGWEHYK